jgi:LysR family hca operon transcriptional activator
VDIRATHEVHNLAHAFSIIASTHAVTLLPAYAKNFLPVALANRPIQGDPPMVDLVLGYNKANASPILKLFLTRVDKLIARA